MAICLDFYKHLEIDIDPFLPCRWMHQHGFHVERRFGWDTHGLPVEYEIDKTLGIKGPQDVAKMGIAAYNAVRNKFSTVYSFIKHSTLITGVP